MIRKYSSFALISEFCDCNFLQLFDFMSSTKNRERNLIIIKCLSLLVTNLKQDRNVFYFFSKNFLNNIITVNSMAFATDEDFTFYFVNFLKSLSLKIDDKTIGFFYNSETLSFPILSAAMNYYNFDEPMIRNAARTIMAKFIKSFSLKSELPSIDRLFH